MSLGRVTEGHQGGARRAGDSPVVTRPSGVGSAPTWKRKLFELGGGRKSQSGYFGAMTPALSSGQGSRVLLCGSPQPKKRRTSCAWAMASA